MKKVFAISVISLTLILVGCDLFKTNLGVKVSGKVSNNGIATSGAVTILLNSKDAINNISSLNVDDLTSLTSIVKGVAQTNGAGDYSMPLVQEGTYVLAAIYDENDNSTLDSLDEIGWYGTDSTVIANNDTITFTVPDTFVVQNGVNRTGINVRYMISKALYDSLSTK